MGVGFWRAAGARLARRGKRRICLWSFLRLQPFARRSAAMVESSSGWVGFSPRAPKIVGVDDAAAEVPRPHAVGEGSGGR
jgi:hypothetical protein